MALRISLVIPAQAGIQWRKCPVICQRSKAVPFRATHRCSASLLDDSLRSPLRGHPSGVLRATLVRPAPGWRRFGRFRQSI